MLKFISATILIFISFVVFSHAEHDKPRYVANNGVDQGRCDKAATPCKTIGFAAAQSNKGDIVYVSSGEYFIEDVSDIFYLTGSLIKVKGGFSQQDKFKVQSAKNNPTLIHGIPAEYHQTLVSKGFKPQSDLKAMSAEKQAELKEKIFAVKALSQQQKNVQCMDGMAGSYACNNMDLVSHVPLENMSSKPPSGNDVWGHVDLNTNNEYALMGIRNGTAVFNLSNPSNPVEVGTVRGLNASWRDIKVYQYYDDTAKRWFAYAYVSTDGADDGITIIDLNDLPNSVSLVKKDYTDDSAHNVYISNVDYSTGVAVNNYVPKLHVMGSNNYGGAHRSYSLSNPESLSPAYVPFDKSRNDYTHDGASMVVTDSRVQDQCNRSGAFCDVFIDFNENQLRLWDQTDPAATTELASASYQGAQYVHSGWWSEDKKFVFLHDEQDELYNGIDTTLYVFDVRNLNLPVLSGKWIGSTPTIDHNGYVRGNRYYMSNYEKGVTVLDITSPSNPIEIGNFDTFPVSNNTSFNGAWGVYPFLPSGLILVSDINSGLYVLQDNTRTVDEGQLQFTQSSYTTEEGETVTFNVERVNGSTGEVSVQFKTLQLSANSDDFTATTGTLTWADGDTTTKTIDVLTTLDTDDTEFSEIFSTMLFNVQGGATLGQYKSAQAVINGLIDYGNVSFSKPEFTIYEGVNSTNGQSLINIDLIRSISDEGALSVTVGVDSSTPVNARDDITITSDTVQWADGEQGAKSITVAINNDTLEEALEQITLTLTSSTPSNAFVSATTVLNLYDDDSNTAPSFSMASDTFTIGTNYDLSQVVSDITDEALDLLTYEWQVLSAANGETLTNENALDAVFTASNEGTYDVSLTITDVFGVSTQQQVVLTVAEPAGQDDLGNDSNESSSGGSSMSLNWLYLSLLLIFTRRTRNYLLKH